MEKRPVLEAKIVTCPVLNQIIFSPSINLNDFSELFSAHSTLFSVKRQCLATQPDGCLDNCNLIHRLNAVAGADIDIDDD